MAKLLVLRQGSQFRCWTECFDSCISSLIFGTMNWRCFSLTNGSTLGHFFVMVFIITIFFARSHFDRLLHEQFDFGGSVLEHQQLRLALASLQGIEQDCFLRVPWLQLWNKIPFVFHDNSNIYERSVGFCKSSEELCCVKVQLLHISKSSILQ